MKTTLVTLLFSTLAACGSDPSGTNTTCGAGTVLTNGECVPTSGSLTCGTGTHEATGTCVPDVPADVAAPTIASITPGAAGISGGTVFVITGTNFAGPGAGTATVKFGVQDADVAAISDTKIAGTIPPGTSITATVTVTTAKGTATTPFQYLAVFAAEGRGMTNGELFIIDPTNGFWAPLGTLTDATTATTTYGLTGLAFDTNGTLYGTTAPGGTGTPQLVTVDPATAVVTAIGNLDDGGTLHHITDIKFMGATLYGNAGDAGLMTINTTTGALTQIGQDIMVGGGMAFDGNGTLFTATFGDLNSVDLGTGTMTFASTLDYAKPVNAMATIGTTLVGSFDNSTTGNGLGDDLASTRSLATLDPATGTTSWISEMPAFEGFQSQIDAIATAPDALVLANQATPTPWHAPRPRATTVAPRTSACPSTIAARGHRVALGHHQHVALDSLGTGTGTLHVATCSGGSLDITDASHYALVGKGRGGVKLIDTTTHRTVLRDVQSISE